ncbi:MAG: hypothetical protein ACKOA9_03560 [Actinomycetota bacterium]
MRFVTDLRVEGIDGADPDESTAVPRTFMRDLLHVARGSDLVPLG